MNESMEARANGMFTQVRGRNARQIVLAVLEYVGRDGLTDHEIAEGVHFSFGLITPEKHSTADLVTARQQLVAEGDVVDAGRTRHVSHETEERVWMLARFEEGEAA